jgi:hypothetical protein
LLVVDGTLNVCFWPKAPVQENTASGSNGQSAALWELLMFSGLDQFQLAGMVLTPDARFVSKMSYIRKR